MIDEPVYENVYGKAIDPDKRGRHDTTASALEAAFKELTTQHNPFFDSLADRWLALFPDLPIRLGRYEDGYIFLYVRSAPAFYMMRPKLRMVEQKLKTLPGAPKKLNLRLEIHSAK